jgi:hypothetical protein
VVVRGTARVTIGDEGAGAAQERIGLRAKRRAAPSGNPGKIDLEQTGSYRGEDNSERIEDDYAGGDKWDPVPSSW